MPVIKHDLMTATLSIESIWLHNIFITGFLAKLPLVISKMTAIVAVICGKWLLLLSNFIQLMAHTKSKIINTIRTTNIAVNQNGS